nr:integrase, catalytic region, zinc finger, CCHC-type, peptidase aspartic, catalytic [Tanacetum cinerariifolium]
MKEEKIKQELEEIENINIELDHRVTKLIAENEHLKQTYKQLYDSIKSSCIQSKEQCDDLIKQVNIKSAENSDLNVSLQEKVLVITSLKDTLIKIKGKAVVDEAVILHPIDPELLKIDVVQLAPKLRNNMSAHYNYLKHTQEETATLREIVKHERSLNPLNTSLDYALGNAYPLTMIITTAKVPLRKPIPLESNTPKPVVVQIVLWYLDSGCSKHITGDRSQLTNFVNKFLGTVKFGNDHVAKIMGYGDYKIGNVTISRVYFVEGLGHNLFSAGQFCDSDLEVGISHETSVARSPQQNGVVKRRNRTLIEAARTIVDPPSLEVIAPITEVVSPKLVESTGLPSSTIVDQDAPSPSKSQTTPKTQPPFISNDVEEDNHDIEVAHMGNDPFFDAVTQSCWIKAMQEELNEFELLEVWELVPRPDKVMVITLKWIYKVKLDELGGILKNKARLVAHGYR